MADDNATKKEPFQEEEAKEKKGELSETDLDKFSGGVDAATCPVCGGPLDHIHENR